MMSAMSRRLRALVPLAVLGLASAACSGGNNVPVNSTGFGANAAYTGPPAATVTLKYSSFEPSIVAIHAGRSVQWVWQDAPIAHNVRLAGPSGVVLAQSPTVTTGTWSYTFTRPGTYPYVSTVDAKMGGTVVVSP